MASAFTNSTIIDFWNSKSIDSIAFLQQRLLPYEWWIIQSSLLTDNREIFLFFFPLITGVFNSLGIKSLWAAILSEWSNLILKWIFKGDRPYWWVRETDIYPSGLRPKLRQFPNTCESGPGTPSGHLTINVALFYVITKGFLKSQVWTSKRYRCSKYLLAGLTYLFYGVSIGAIFISRLYIQAHFIHQCIFGVLTGLIVGHITWNNKWLMKPHIFGSIVFANILVCSSLITYGVLLNKGLDPLWTIPLAMKHCTKPEYVFIDTQPYYLMVRFSAMALGLGFAVASKKRKISTVSQRSYTHIMLTVTMGVTLGRAISLVQKNIPQENLMVYLSSNFTLQLIFPYAVIVLVPYILHLIIQLFTKKN